MFDRSMVKTGDNHDAIVSNTFQNECPVVRGYIACLHMDGGSCLGHQQLFVFWSLGRQEDQMHER